MELRLLHQKLRLNRAIRPGSIILGHSCATGWFYYKSCCYGYFQKLKNWSDAELECQSYGNGTHLASILYLKEANTIATYIGGCQRNKPVWICLHDLQKGQQWTWLDGATYIYRTMSGKSVGGNKYYAEMNAMNTTLFSYKATALSQTFTDHFTIFAISPYQRFSYQYIL
ncbi:LOW QUALITY PROTEIN: regenerating islet-derived protein 4 [Delphinapterus leucas]|uniref:LOW QUALITY PROTEIN: regenerating islet-derived protein 4 n=1 Tax=Delphinapterus leucas TaxID=9749 RepID=A0A7F8K5G9_DELLE|nr:LOW QUALITY PROTEIN: regenerating islet-derived protein 4 [Delphinapterus leucas]